MLDQEDKLVEPHQAEKKMVSTEDADFAFGVSSHDGTIWVFPVELFQILGTKQKIHYSNIFKEN